MKAGEVLDEEAPVTPLQGPARRVALAGTINLDRLVYHTPAGRLVEESPGGLLYSLNRVMHTMDTSQATAAAFMISTGVVILFWNLLALLSRLTSRD